MEKEIKIGNLFYLETDREKQVIIDDETFVIKALFSKELKEIAKRRAFETEGLPENSFSTGDLLLFERDITIDVALKEFPDWWESSEDCPDEELKNTLYKEIQKHNITFQKLLKKNKRKRRST